MTVQLVLRDRIYDLDKQLLANGSLQVQRIDNGFIVQCVTLGLPIAQPTMFGQPIQARTRTFFCATVEELARTVGVLMQLPWRPLDEAGQDQPT